MVDVRHLFNPAKLGTVAAFLVCFAIIMSPPHALVRVHAPAEPSAAQTRHEPDRARFAEGLQADSRTWGIVSERSEDTADLAAQRLELAGSGSVISLGADSSGVSGAAAEPAPEQLQTQAPNGIPSERARAEEVQRRLIQFGLIPTSTTVTWDGAGASRAELSR
jgi:hypothetical protein